MIKVITIKYRFFNQTSKFILKSGECDLNDYVVFGYKGITEFGQVISIDLVPQFQIFPDIVDASFRVATEDDFKKIEKIKKDEQHALKIVKYQAKTNYINLKILNVEYSFDKHKLRVFFSSDEKIDFKILLNNLFKIFKILIEFKSINSRILAKNIGGVGICGRVICCKSFLNSPKKIIAESIVNQKMYLGGTNFCGFCGRLMCCLDYEEKMYGKSLEELPKVGEIINTPKGLSIVIGVDAISEIIKVSLAENPDSPPLLFKASELI